MPTSWAPVVSGGKAFYTAKIIGKNIILKVTCKNSLLGGRKTWILSPVVIGAQIRTQINYIHPESEARSEPQFCDPVR
ncbi:hypothetical protein SDJN02_18972, partial [Cucurbita argyrosperma subsp. argyrosperma]